MNIFEFADRYNELSKKLTLSRDEVLDLVEEFCKKQLDTDIYYIKRRVEGSKVVEVREKVKYRDKVWEVLKQE